jgi:hypothetical protein
VARAQVEHGNMREDGAGHSGYACIVQRADASELRHVRPCAGRCRWLVSEARHAELGTPVLSAPDGGR